MNDDMSHSDDEMLDSLADEMLGSLADEMLDSLADKMLDSLADKMLMEMAEDTQQPSSTSPPAVPSLWSQGIAPAPNTSSRQHAGFRSHDVSNDALDVPIFCGNANAHAVLEGGAISLQQAPIFWQELVKRHVPWLMNIDRQGRDQAVRLRCFQEPHQAAQSLLPNDDLSNVQRVHGSGHHAGQHAKQGGALCSTEAQSAVAGAKGWRRVASWADWDGNRHNRDASHLAFFVPSDNTGRTSILSPTRSIPSRIEPPVTPLLKFSI